jgi:hypothetical protein
LCDNNYDDAEDGTHAPDSSICSSGTLEAPAGKGREADGGGENHAVDTVLGNSGLLVGAGIAAPGSREREGGAVATMLGNSGLLVGERMATLGSGRRDSGAVISILDNISLLVGAGMVAPEMEMRMEPVAL